MIKSSKSLLISLQTKPFEPVSCGQQIEPMSIIGLVVYAESL